jgi:hypothetical protein
MEKAMAQRKDPPTTSGPNRFQTARTWSITLGISAVLLTVMYTAAVMRYGTPHFAGADSLIGELSHGNRI